MSDGWALLDDDKIMGRKVWVRVDDRTGTPVEARIEQDIDMVVAANREAEKASHGRKFDDFNRVASVPLTFLEKTGLGEAIDQGDKRYMRKILNDSDNSGLRTSRGKV